MTKFLKKNWLLILSLIYILSPIDLIPEAFLGPLGLIDDAGLLFILILKAIIQFLQERQRIGDLNEIAPEK
jgi:uncharacterized membrane protein YkvA (DUF1232 family)